MLNQNDIQNPRRLLLTIFSAWKLFLLAAALGSALVSEAYDTSGSLALSLRSSREPRGGLGLTAHPTWLHLLAARLTSWDAIYFVTAARRGYEFEQEWAFGSGLQLLIRGLVKGWRSLGMASDVDDLPLESLAGIAAANFSHLLATLVLYQLSTVVWQDYKLAFFAAVAHIISPAGVFLSAPYAESSTALLSFTGYLFLAYRCRLSGSSVCQDALAFAAGASFGLATAFRSNGILNGIPFAWEFLQTLDSLLRPSSDRTASSSVFSKLRHLAVLVCSGLLVALGDNGLFRYWTVPNIPLFMLAAPMLYVLLKSGVALLTSAGTIPAIADNAKISRINLKELVQSAAASQILLAVLVLFNSHVQIITRISSGSPLWYWWLADTLMSHKSKETANRLVMYMIMYASIQGSLFAAFLPPA